MAGELTCHDPEYTQGTGKLVQRFDFSTPVLMTGERLESAILFAARQFKQTAEVHQLGPIQWPPETDIRPRRDYRGATIILTTVAEECREALLLN